VGSGQATLEVLVQVAPVVPEVQAVIASGGEDPIPILDLAAAVVGTLAGAMAPGAAAGAMDDAARGTATATRASSAAQGALVRAQLAAEEVAGARLPLAITGYTRHGLNQAISRDGVGVSTRAIMDALKNPTSIAGQSGGRFVLTGKEAVVVINAEGRVVTTWATNSAGVRVVP
jgi:hypothetical protein